MSEPLDPMTGEQLDRQRQKLLEKYMAMEGDEMGFEINRVKEAIGRDGLSKTYTVEAMRFMQEQINLFIHTRALRRWQESGFGAQRLIVTVKVEVQ